MKGGEGRGGGRVVSQWLPRQQTPKKGTLSVPASPFSAPRFHGITHASAPLRVLKKLMHRTAAGKGVDVMGPDCQDSAEVGGLGGVWVGE